MNMNDATTGSIEMEAEETDEALMAALQGGDDAALAPLMRRWELPVKGFVARLGVPSAEVEDVAQETFARVFAKRGSFRAGAAFKPWLLTIAGNLARNRHRWRRRHPAESLDALLDAGAGEPGPEPTRADEPEQGAAADAARLAAGVRSAVEALPAPLREAVVCVELEDMSHAEAAAVLACTTKAVETRLYRARAALRERLRSFFAEV
jgi:RNA polymerase sigma-70 factor (ECF subfamily)